jgi:hypothetical protein
MSPERKWRGATSPMRLGRHIRSAQQVLELRGPAPMTAMASRLSRNPFLLGMSLIAATAVGSSMLRPLLREFHQRAGGSWYQASCLVDDYVFAPELRVLQQFVERDSDLHTGKTQWVFIAAYNVTVRLQDGCDGDSAHEPGPIEEQARERDEEEDGFFIYDDNAAAVDRVGADGTRNDGTSGDGPWADGSADRTAPAGSHAHALEQLHTHPHTSPQRLLSQGTAPPLPLPQRRDNQSATVAAGAAAPPPHCERIIPRNDHLRGKHVAYYYLTRELESYCQGPVDHTVEQALDFCVRHVHHWFKHMFPIGSARQCYLFEKPRALDDIEVHVVFDRRLPVSIYFYVAYSLGLLALAARTAYFAGRRVLQAMGALPPDRGKWESLEGDRAAVARISVWSGQGSPMRNHVIRGGSYGRLGIPEHIPPAPPRPRTVLGWVRYALGPTSRGVSEFVLARRRRDTLSNPVGTDIGGVRPDEIGNMY